MRAAALQAAVVLIVAGLLIALAGMAPRRSRPTPVTTWRPATEQEQRQHDADRLSEELDRLQEARR